MSGILSRILGSHGIDRTIDTEIDLVVTPGSSVWSPDWWSGSPNDFLTWGTEGQPDYGYRQILRYTDSLDDACTLFSNLELPGAFANAMKAMNNKYYTSQDDWRQMFIRQLLYERFSKPYSQQEI